MHYGSESVACRDVNIGSITYILNDLTEIDQIGRIENVIVDNARRNRWSGTYTWDRNSRVVISKYGVVA